MPIQISVKKATQNPTTASGLTFAEPVFNSTNNTFWIGKGASAPVWIGAGITGASGAIISGSSISIPTANAVKGYVESVLPVNFVNSVSGLTGTVGITAGTNITVSVTGNNIQISSNSASSAFAIAMAIAL